MDTGVKAGTNGGHGCGGSEETHEGRDPLLGHASNGAGDANGTHHVALRGPNDCGNGDHSRLRLFERQAEAPFVRRRELSQQCSSALAPNIRLAVDGTSPTLTP